ncbi:hypothetical protein [Polyangium mundeleinium]|uniref:NERD domain-containing protein n=1 Tax=Polyangium mundeleinium TaxID=2995306 RepID=A0ABT5EN20_9BACT|nr:hypothetical protein [Polyangium mundeleinium]MDC0743136.1 hypothetical protein [Polyangium mundeleinium]
MMTMDLSDKDELGRACQRICGILGVQVQPGVLEAYLRGQDRALISYEKLEQSPTTIPAVIKYVLAAESYRRQPAVECYYDIFRCARMVPLLLFLDRASRIVKQKVAHADDRLVRLGRETKLDAFDAALFEIVTAARYAECPEVTEVAFIPETHQQQPDLRVTTPNGVLYVECKRFDRSSNAAIDLRFTARQKAQAILACLQHVAISAVVEVVFKVNPADITNEEIVYAAGVAIRTGAPYETDKFHIDHRRLVCGPLEDYMLFPSALYFANRYGFSTDGDWHGLVPNLYAKYAGPSFLDDVQWEAAVKWKVTDNRLLWQQKRLGYSLLFKGLDQLAAPHDSAETVLHVCFERDNPLGPRRDELLHFLETLRKNSDKHTFGWTIFNELVINMSPAGRFDFVEHAHAIAGPKRMSSRPHVATVFVPESAIRSSVGAFGVGVEMPPVDVDPAIHEQED